MSLSRGGASTGDFIVTGGTVTLADGTVITGHSPAIIVNGGGTVDLEDATAQTATDAPTIVVSGGSLVAQDSTILGTTGAHLEPAILVTSGSVDLGTASSPGRNIIDVSGSGAFLQDPAFIQVSDTGDTFEVNGTPISATHFSATALSSSAVTTTYGQSVTLTADVATADGAGGTPSGCVEFIDTTTGTDLQTVALSNGIAQWTTGALPAGSDEIAALYLGSGTFASSIDTLTQMVTPAALTIAANDVSRVYGASDPTLGVSYSGFVNGETSSVLVGTLSVVDADPATTTPVGTYTGAITASGLTATNYTVTYVAGNLIVTAAPLTVTASNESMTYGGGTVPALAYTYTGLVNGNTSASFTGAWRPAPRRRATSAATRLPREPLPRPATTRSAGSTRAR